MNLRGEATHCSVKNKNMLFKVSGNKTYLLAWSESEWISLSMSYLELLEWGVTEIDYKPIDWVSLLENGNV